MGKLRGQNILILHTTGRKSGKSRKTPLMYFEDGNNYLIIASNSGRSSNPSWYYNMKGKQTIEVQILHQILHCQINIASNDEKARVWPLVISKAPFYDDYRKKTSKNIPVIFLTPITPSN